MARLLVVGAGLVGSVLAVFLGRRGHQVEVFERDADARTMPKSRRPALNITLCERGLRSLEMVGMRTAVMALCAPVRGRKLHGVDGSLRYQPYGNHGEAIYSIARSDLNDTLLNLAEREPGVRFHFQHKCLQLDLDRPLAVFQSTKSEDTVEIAGDHIFAADGAYSSVRLQMQKTERFNYSQQYWNQGYTSLKIPVQPGAVPAFEQGVLHIWPRGDCMLIAFPNVDGRVSCSVLLGFEGDRSYEALSNEKRLISFFRESFQDAAPLMSDLPEQFFSQRPNTLLTVRCNPWSYKDKVLLVGDAAHAFLPSYGQGANAGFEDCSVLDSCVREYPNDWRAAFLAFEERRRPSTDAMAELCIEHFVELCTLVADEGFLKRRETERQLAEIYPNLYQPLYSMITFGLTSYADAVRIERRQRALVDRIVALPDLHQRIATPEVRRWLEESLRAPS